MRHSLTGERQKGGSASILRADQTLPVAAIRNVVIWANRPGTNRVRYGWADAPFVNLYGADDLPAVPFASDIR